MLAAEMLQVKRIKMGSGVVHKMFGMTLVEVLLGIQKSDSKIKK